MPMARKSLASAFPSLLTVAAELTGVAHASTRSSSCDWDEPHGAPARTGHEAPGTSQRAQPDRRRCRRAAALLGYEDQPAGDRCAAAEPARCPGLVRDLRGRCFDIG